MSQLPHLSINCKGSLIDLAKPRVMGILNRTPDSFYDGGKLNTNRALLEQAEKMLNEGATFLDLGGYSSRPGATNISEEEELQRVVPAMELLQKHFPEALISIDTFRSRVAVACVEAGAALVNDITAGRADAEMLPRVAKMRLPYIAMHSRGMPQTMQEHTNYTDLIREVVLELSERLQAIRKAGINDVLIDPGFGFAKTLEQNYELLRQATDLKQLGVPILIGVSRKSMLYKLLKTKPENALNATTVWHVLLLQKGASVLRTHDVREAVECVKIVETYKGLP